MLQIKEQAGQLQKTPRYINTLIGVTISLLHFGLIWLMALAIFSGLITPVFRLFRTFFTAREKDPAEIEKLGPS